MSYIPSLSFSEVYHFFHKMVKHSWLSKKNITRYWFIIALKKAYVIFRP